MRTTGVRTGREKCILIGICEHFMSMKQVKQLLFQAFTQEMSIQKYLKRIWHEER